MAYPVVETVIDALVCTDTNPHASSVFNVEPGTKFMLAYYNGWNQAATVRAYGGFDFDGAMWWPLGSGTTAVASTAYNYDVITEHWPYMKVIVTAGVSPASGTFTAYFKKIA